MVAAFAPPTPFGPHGLRQHRLFESHDLDDTRERISKVMQPHTLVPNGRAAGGAAHMDFVRIGGIGLGTIAFGEPMRVDVGLLEDYHLLMFCLNGRAQVLADDRQVEVHQHLGMLSGPGRPLATRPCSIAKHAPRAATPAGDPGRTRPSRASIAAEVVDS